MTVPAQLPDSGFGAMADLLGQIKQRRLALDGCAWTWDPLPRPFAADGTAPAGYPLAASGGVGSACPFLHGEQGVGLGFYDAAAFWLTPSDGRTMLTSLRIAAVSPTVYQWFWRTCDKPDEAKEVPARGDMGRFGGDAAHVAATRLMVDASGEILWLESARRDEPDSDNAGPAGEDQD